ncbi:hypothetical protein ACJZ2D_005779 [Fusarium nematophilum]
MNHPATPRTFVGDQVTSTSVNPHSIKTPKNLNTTQSCRDAKDELIQAHSQLPHQLHPFVFHLFPNPRSFKMPPSLGRQHFVESCVRLVDYNLPACYPPGGEWASAGPSSSLLVADDSTRTVSLWATSLVAGQTVLINTTLPGLRQQLRELAQSGAPWADYLGVRYHFLITGSGSVWVDDPADLNCLGGVVSMNM